MGLIKHIPIAVVVIVIEEVMQEAFALHLIRPSSFVHSLRVSGWQSAILLNLFIYS